MKAPIALLIVSACLIHAGASAVEVDIPEFVGEYPRPVVTVSVDFGMPVLDVSQVYLELEGTLSSSWVIAAGDTMPWGAEFIGTFVDDGPGWWAAGMETGGVWEGEFHSLAPFWGSSQATSDFLHDGRADIFMDFVAGGLIDVQEVGPYPGGTITSATLIYEGPTGNESSTWGAMKTLYRP